jgi:hypothetical protein
MKTKRTGGERVRHGLDRRTVRNCGYSDDRAELQVVGQCDPEAISDIDSSSQRGTARASVNEDGATVSGRPCSVFEPLATSANKPRPRLVDGEKTHRNP